MSSIDEAFRKSMTDEEYKKITALDANDPNVKKFVSEVHEKLIAINDNIHYDKDNILTENRIFAIFALNPALTCQECATKFSKQFRKISEREIRDILEDLGITDDLTRAEILKWSQDTVTKFETALKSATPQNFSLYLNCFKEKKREKMRTSEFRRTDEIRRRIFCIMLFKKNRLLMSKEDTKLLEKFGNKYSKDLSFDINDILMNLCGVQRESATQKAVRRATETLKKELEKQEIENDTLKNDIEEHRKALEKQEIENDTLKNDIEEQLQDERINFFAALNSEKYGCILDEIINALNGRKKLRKQNIELPLEINGIFVLVDKIAKFVKNNGINPVMEPGAIKNMSVGEIEAWNAEYSGTPFANADEIKRVKVISPGWYYKDKEIQISRPKLLEYAED